ncbi:MAG: sensor histidine kinase [Solirubrobacteraceae bacterium]
MSPLALRGRVVVASVLVLAVGVGAIGLGLNVLLTRTLSGDADAVLRARADAQQTTIDVARGRVVVREGTQDEALDREAWVFAAGAVVARPPASAALHREAASLSRVTVKTIRNVPGEVRLLAEPAYASKGRTRIATIVVGVSLAPYERTERLARGGTIIFALFVLLAGAIIAWRAVGAALRPVAEMARAAEDYSEHDLSRRFGLGPARDEITGLAATLDGLLDRLQASLGREQRLSAEIAHELRTPLSGIRGEAELAMLDAGGPSSAHDALRAVVAGADRMSAAIDALLMAARHVDPASATCELDEAVRMALDASELQARQQSVALEVADALPEVRVTADAGFIAQALAPLLDNAIRHARSQVVIRGTTDGTSVTVAIEDDGAGIAERDAAGIFEPGVKTSGGSGAGLGLALSRRLARSIGGEVRADSSTRGARLIVELPTVARGSAG